MERNTSTETLTELVERLFTANQQFTETAEAARQRILFCAERRRQLAQHPDYFNLIVAPVYRGIVAEYQAGRLM